MDGAPPNQRLFLARHFRLKPEGMSVAFPVRPNTRSCLSDQRPKVGDLDIVGFMGAVRWVDTPLTQVVGRFYPKGVGTLNGIRYVGGNGAGASFRGEFHRNDRF